MLKRRHLEDSRAHLPAIEQVVHLAGDGRARGASHALERIFLLRPMLIHLEMLSSPSPGFAVIFRAVPAR